MHRILKDCKTEDLAVFATKVMETYVPELRGRMGKVYTDTVSSCLEGNFGTGYTGGNDGDDVEQRMRSFSEDFEKPECLRTGRFFYKFPCPVEASTRIRLSICTDTPI